MKINLKNKYSGKVPVDVEKYEVLVDIAPINLEKGDTLTISSDMKVNRLGLSFEKVFEDIKMKVTKVKVIVNKGSNEAEVILV